MSTTFSRGAEPPQWLRSFFDEMDNKRFGPELSELFLPEGELFFGFRCLGSFAEIKAHLEDFGGRMNTDHRIREFWGSSKVNIFRGEIRFSTIAGGEERVSQVLHALYMDEVEPGRIRRWYGAAGPGVS